MFRPSCRTSSAGSASRRSGRLDVERRVLITEQAQRGSAMGAFVLLLFLYGDGTKHSVDVVLADVDDVTSEGDSLTIRRRDDEMRFTDLSPGVAAGAFLAEIRRRRTPSEPA